MPLLSPLHTDLAAPLPWEARRATSSWLAGVALLLGALWVLLDQASKQLAAVLLSPAGVGRQELPGPLTLQLTFNDGGAYGYDAPWWFFLVVTAIVTVIVVRKLPHVHTMLEANAYGMLLAGAWGNGLDRVFRQGDRADPRFLHGHVVDFFASSRFPTFNVADVAITGGFLLLIISLIVEDRRHARAAKLVVA
ncbi:MAG: signal peptidase II [Glaciecola sp.]|jgi:signal peptidase II